MPTRTLHIDVLVIGAGVTGATIAAQFAEQGALVGVVDALSSSRAARAELSLVTPHLHPDHFATTARGVEQFVQRCTQYGVPYQPCEVLHAATTQRGEAQMRTAIAQYASVLRDWIGPTARGAGGSVGFIIRKSALVDASQLVARMLEHPNIILRQSVEVLGLDYRGGVMYALASGYTFTAKWVVLATNAFTGLLSPYLAESVRFATGALWQSYPLRSGVLLPERPVVLDDGAYVFIPSAERRLYIRTWTTHKNGYLADPLQQLSELLKRIDPALLEYTAERRLSVLTFTDDQAPLVGRIESGAPVLYALGLGMFGLAWAPIVAERVVSLAQS
ncbi:MAG: FAD-dependent oxidoreductase [Anaerolineae bacterium]|nr:FAD-binding oxidoreductase [Thermoflexales bacterium]MDW8396087.1 FAD-dependent oxidoreductase [Anaerolineae bacterium]